MKSDIKTSSEERAAEFKEELLKRSSAHREEFEQEVERITKRTKSIINNTLLIGGTLLAGYLMVRMISGSSRKSNTDSREDDKDHYVDRKRYEVKEKPAPGVMSQVGSVLASQAAIFLVGLAKDRLSNFFNANTQSEEAK